jgi:hypothetical protein
MQTAPPITRPRRPIPTPEHLTLPKDWRERFTDPELVKVLANYERLAAERGASHKAKVEAEAGLETAGVRDRDELAAAIHAGKPLPTSDAHARKASSELAEAVRRDDATRQAHAAASRDALRVVAERRDDVVADLNGRIESATAEANAALSRLDSALGELAGLRGARLFLVDKAHRSGDVRAVAWRREVQPQVEALIAEPARRSEAMTVTGDD